MKNEKTKPKNFFEGLISKFKAALYVFFKSLTTPQYYKDLRDTKFGFSLKYILILAVIASAVTAPKVTMSLKNDLVNELDKFSTQVINYFPEDLVITVRSGELSLNQEEPFFIPIPDEYKEEVLVGTEGQIIDLDNVLVVDPEGTIDSLEEYKTLVLVNKANIIIRESNKVETYPLKDAPDTEIKRQDVIDFMNKMDPLFNALPYIFLTVAFLLSLVYYFGFRLIYLLFVAGVLYVVNLARGTDLEFNKLYQIGIHSMTLPLVVEVFSTVAEVPINIPMWFLVLNLLMGITGLFYIEKNSN